MKVPRYLRFLEWVFVIVSMLVFFRAFTWLFFSPAGGAPDNSIDKITAIHGGLMYVYISIYCVAALLIIRQWRDILELAFREKFLFILLVVAAVSAIWSVVPKITLASWVALSGTTLFGVYFAFRFNLCEQLKLLAWTSIIVVGSSFVAAVFFPETGLMTGYHQGLWRGVFIHKNILGMVMPLASITFFILAAKHTSWLYWFCFCLALILLALSGSKSSLLAYTALFSGISAYLALIGQRKLCLVALLSVLVAGSSLGAQVKLGIFPAAIYSEIRQILSVNAQKEREAGGVNVWTSVRAFLNRARGAAPESADSASLTSASGRVALWKELRKRQQKRPVLGYGLSGFWLGTSGPSKHIWEVVHWKPNRAHNGFLELVLDLGLVGLALFLFSFAQAAYQSIKQLRMTSFNPVGIYVPALLAYILLTNIGESALFVPNLLVWVCYVSAAISLLMQPEQVR